MKTHKNLKGLLILFAGVVMVLGIVYTTVAFLQTKTTPLENEFVYAEVSSEVVEDFVDGDTTKSNVRIENTGNTAAYIRATFVITFQNDANEVSSKVPVENTDYTIVPGTGWTLQSEDGYYYYNEIVESGDETSNLINSIVSLDHPEGYTLSVEIIADAIQATPPEAVQQAWPLSGLGGNGQ